MLALKVVFLAAISAVAAQQGCNPGDCRANAKGYDLCGSGIWYSFTTPYYACQDGRINPVTPGDPSSSADSSMPSTTSHSTSSAVTPISPYAPPSGPSLSYTSSVYVTTTLLTRTSSSPASSSSTESPATSPPPPTSSTTTVAVPPISPASSASTAYATPPASSTPGQTGYSACQHVQNVDRLSSNGAGRSTYQPGGTMASYYQADASSTFRCDGVAFPSNGYFAAVWTQYSAGLPSQPAPLNCGDLLTVTNPANGRTAQVTIIDRCASCVGVGYDPKDPTLPLDLINGATIDLGPAAFNYLYDGAAPDVFDITYGGKPRSGWNADPAPLSASPSSQECNAS